MKKFSENIDTGYGISHYRLINQILKDIMSKKNKSIITADESYETNKLIHAMYCSHEQKKAIKLNTNPTSKKIRKIMDNKFPGKDISYEDLKTKFPLAAKK